MFHGGASTSDAKTLTMTSHSHSPDAFFLTLGHLGYEQTVRIKEKLDSLETGGILEVTWVDRPLAEEAWAVFQRFNRDKRWSFTDCVSYAVMKRRGIVEAFAFDHHFDQMGFTRRP